MGGVLMEAAWQGVGNCLDRFSEKELSGRRLPERAPTSFLKSKLRMGEQKGRGPEENDRGQTFRLLTISSHCWTLVVKVLGAHFTQHLGIHLL